MISGWVQKVTQHNEILQYSHDLDILSRRAGPETIPDSCTTAAAPNNRPSSVAPADPPDLPSHWWKPASRHRQTASHSPSSPSSGQTAPNSSPPNRWIYSPRRKYYTAATPAPPECSARFRWKTACNCPDRCVEIHSGHRGRWGGVAVCPGDRPGRPRDWVRPRGRCRGRTGPRPGRGWPGRRCSRETCCRRRCGPPSSWRGSRWRGRAGRAGWHCGRGWWSWRSPPCRRRWCRWRGGACRSRRWLYKLK